MVGRAVLTTEMSRTTRIWAARATASRAQDFLGACSSVAAVSVRGVGLWRRGGTSELLRDSVRWVVGRVVSAVASRCGPRRRPRRWRAPTRRRGARRRSDPAWVESTSRCRWLSDRAASWSWAASQPSVPSESEVVSTASGRPCSEVSAWAWREHRRDHRDLVAPVAGGACGGRHRLGAADRIGRQARAGAEQRAETEPGQRGQEGQAAPQCQGVLAGVARDAGATARGSSCPAAPCRRPAAGTARRRSARRGRRWSARPGRRGRVRRLRRAGACRSRAAVTPSWGLLASSLQPCPARS